jgi:hypothetical protein
MKNDDCEKMIGRIVEAIIGMIKMVDSLYLWPQQAGVWTKEE